MVFFTPQGKSEVGSVKVCEAGKGRRAWAGEVGA